MKILLKRFLFPAVAFLLGTLLLLTAGELAFRFLFSFRNTNPIAYQLKNNLSKDPLTIQIATLGESTTEALIENGIDISWPQQLETKLNEHLRKTGSRYQAKVINLALGGSSSTFQVSALLSAFADQSPDAIISMIGINDHPRNPIERNALYESSYLARFVYWALIAYRCPNCYLRELGRPTTYAASLTKEESEAQDSAIKLFKELDREIDPRKSDRENKAAFETYKKRYADLRPTFKSGEPIANGDSAIHLFRLSLRPEFRKRHPELHDEVLRFALETLNLSYEKTVLVHPPYAQHFCHIKFRLDGSDCFKDLKKALQNGMPVTYPMLKMLSVQEGAKEDPFFQALFKSVGFDVDPTQSQDASLLRSYRTVADFANEHEVPLFAMQYPTGSTAGLRAYLAAGESGSSPGLATTFYSKQNEQPLPERYGKTIFVSNENFNDVVTSENVGEYFIDLFGLDRGLHFGHATAKGNARIADNALKALVENWPKIEARKQNFR